MEKKQGEEVRIKRSLLAINIDQGMEIGNGEGVESPAMRTGAGLFLTRQGREASVDVDVDCGIGVDEVGPGSGLGSMPEPASLPSSHPPLTIFSKDGKPLLNPRLLGLAPKKVPVARYIDNQPYPKYHPHSTPFAN